MNDYVKLHGEGEINYSNVKKEHQPVFNSPAFDREALKDPGRFVYYGKEKYYDEDASHENPFPAISSIGLSEYILDLIDKRTYEEEVKEIERKRAVWETGKDAPPWFTRYPEDQNEKGGS
jgi:hypothetical protein